MSTPEDKLLSLSLDTAESEARAQSKKYGGRTSLMFAGINFAGGAFVSTCLMEISGVAERVSETDQYLLVAGGGLVAAVAILRRAYKHNGINLLELVQAPAEAQKAEGFRAKRDELAGWLRGPRELSSDDEKAIEDFRLQIGFEEDSAG